MPALGVRARIVQLVPRLGARLDAVADYARALAGALRESEGIDTFFVRGDPHDDAPGESRAVKRRSPEALRATLANVGARTVLLHYVNYGFEPRGCPSWLVDGLHAWKARDPRARLVTLFHELYASGPPWRSSFWLAPRQRRLAARLARMSDGIVTNSELYRRQLALWVPQRAPNIAAYPVFSTVGEPDRPAPWETRRPALAVLGRAGTEARVYSRWREPAACMVRTLGFEEIVDIGPRAAAVPSRFAGACVRLAGELPAAEVSRLLGQCRAGFVDYPTDVLGKSTVFAAYCAHGLAPVVTHLRAPVLEGLSPGEHFLVAGDGVSPPPSLERIAGHALDWYRGHALPVQAAALAKLVA